MNLSTLRSYILWYSAEYDKVKCEKREGKKRREYKMYKKQNAQKSIHFPKPFYPLQHRGINIIRINHI